jgi:hypothetical protein
MRRAERASTNEASEDFLAAVQATRPGATVVTDEEKAERAQFRKELADRVANDIFQISF